MFEQLLSGIGHNICKQANEWIMTPSSVYLYIRLVCFTSSIPHQCIRLPELLNQIETSINGVLSADGSKIKPHIFTYEIVYSSIQTKYIGKWNKSWHNNCWKNWPLSPHFNWRSRSQDYYGKITFLSSSPRCVRLNRLCACDTREFLEKWPKNSARERIPHSIYNAVEKFRGTGCICI